MQTARGAPLNDSGRGDTETGTERVERRRPRRLRLLLAVGAAVLALDIVTKVVAVEVLADRRPIELLGGALTLTFTRNSGASFGIAGDWTVLFTLVAAGVVIAIVRAGRRLGSVPWAVSLGLVLGGAAGNLVDRIFRDPGLFQGAVVDWLALPNWPVFNLADAGIVVGGVLAALLALTGREFDGARTGKRVADDE